MNSKFKIIFGYVVGLMISLLVSLLAIFITLKTSIYNPNYIKKIVKKEDYYQNVYQDIREEMENYMVSSGFLESILDNIYTLDDVKDDINLYFDKMYLGEVVKIDQDKITKKLNDNIDKYLKDSNLSVINEEDVISFVNDIAEIYEKEVTLYHTFDGFMPSFVKLKNIVDVGIIISSVLIIILLAIMIKYLKTISFGSCLIAASLILLFIRFIIVEKIDIENILLITENFSDILQIILLNIRRLLLISSIIIGVLGFAFLIVSTRKNKSLKY